MARRITHAERTGEVNKGAEASWSAEAQPTAPRPQRAGRDGRERRVLEGQLVSRIRTQARERRAHDAVAGRATRE